MKIVQKLVKIVAVFFILLLPITSTASALATTSSGAGGLDQTFGTGGKVITSFSAYNDAAYAVAIQPNGKIIAAGTRGNMFALARYNSDGVLDSTFGTGGKKSTDFFTSDNYLESGHAVLIQPDEKIVVVGTAYDGNNDNIAVARYTSNGSIDSSFDGDGKANTDFGTYASGNAAALQTDGKIVIAGYAYNATTQQTDFALMRYNTNGSPDSGFGANGQVTTSFNASGDAAYAVAIQPDGQIIAVGTAGGNSSANVALVRYNSSDGSLDSSFGTNGKTKTVVGQYGSGCSSIGYAVTLQPDGKIIVAGTVSLDIGRAFVILRYNNNGILDTTFGDKGKVVTQFNNENIATAATLQPDGKIIVAGYRQFLSSSNSYAFFEVVRYNPDGSLDKIFGYNGYITTYFQTTPSSVGLAFGNAVALQPNGKIIVAGATQPRVNAKTAFALARYDVNSLMRSFVSKAGQDGWILESAENASTGGSLNTTDPTFKLGDDASNRQYRAILSFDTSSLPENAQVQMITLKIKQSGQPIGTNPFNVLGNLWNDAFDPYFGNGPTLELGDFNVPASSPNMRNRFDKTPVNGWYSSSFSQIDINRNGLTQFRLYFGTDDNNNNAADSMNFMSGNANPADRPQLQINYFLYP